MTSDWVYEDKDLLFGPFPIGVTPIKSKANQSTRVVEPGTDPKSVSSLSVPSHVGELLNWKEGESLT